MSLSLSQYFTTSRYITGHDLEVFVPHGRPAVAAGDPAVVVVGAAVHTTIDAVIPGAVSLETVAVLLPVAVAIVSIAVVASLSRSSSGNAATSALAAVAAAWLLALAPGHIACTASGSFDGEAAAPLLVALAVNAWGCAVRRGMDPRTASFAAAAAAACWNWCLVMAWGPSGIVFVVIACHNLTLVANGRFSTRTASVLGVFVAVSAVLFAATATVAPAILQHRLAADLLPWPIGAFLPADVVCFIAHKCFHDCTLDVSLRSFTFTANYPTVFVPNLYR